MLGYSLDILGSEWIIIVLVALALLLGTNQLPSTAKKLGKIVNTKPGDEMRAAIKLAKENNIKIALIDQRIEITLKN